MQARNNDDQYFCSWTFSPYFFFYESCHFLGGGVGGGVVPSVENLQITYWVLILISNSNKAALVFVLRFVFFFIQYSLEAYQAKPFCISQEKNKH